MMDRHENGTANGAAPQILALEIEADEEEQESLIQETAGEAGYGNSKKLFMGRNANGIRRRGWGNGDGIGFDSAGRGSGGGGAQAMIQGFLRSDLMSHAIYHLRNALLLGVMAFFVLVVVEWEGKEIRSEHMEDVKPAPPHTYSYGGKNNVAHNVDPDNPDKPKKPKEYTIEDFEAEILDEAYEKNGGWDISYENDINEEGNYLHDPVLSPFASEYYDATQEELDIRQKNFTDRMEAIKKEFGSWNNPTFEYAQNIGNDFYDTFVFRDIPLEEFPDDAWQKDREYIKSLLDQAQPLVEAVKEGIMQEYNHPNPDDYEKSLFTVIIGDHDFVNGTALHQETKKKQPGVAFLPETAWNGLVRKLLHAMITTDYFYVVVAGTADAYRANNFARTQVMQFNYIMEPVFDKLGMTLISRNMAMDASTTVAALAGADIYGETDVLWHVQGFKEEEKVGEFDLLQKQTILSGERIPVILSPSWDELVLSSKGKAWVGNIQPGADVCQKTTMAVLPDAPACHGVNCDAEGWENGLCHVYNSVCWEPRAGFTPVEQNADVGFQDKKYPGYRRHQLEGRKMALLLLHALGSALSLWRESLEDDRTPLPLATEHWHVEDSYTDIRKSVMSLDRTPGESVEVPACEKFLKDVDPRICHIPMRGFTEWTPRVIPTIQSLRTIVNNMVAGQHSDSPAYDHPDILPLSWRVPPNELDVHMIAIAANVTPSIFFDDDYMNFEEDWVDDFYNGRNLQKDNAKESEEKEGGTEKQQGRNLQKGNATESQEKEGGTEKHQGSDEQTKDNNKESTAKEGGTEKQQGSDEQTSKEVDKEPSTGLELLTGQKLTIVEGSGWTLANSPIGHCDGSAQSRCNRKPDSKCLLANYNDYKGRIEGTPKTGWLTMTLKEVRHGIILARLEFDTLPEDLVFDYAINGEVISLKAPELESFGKALVNDVKVYPLLIDKEMAVPPDVAGPSYDIAVRIRSKTDPECKVGLSHIYFA